MGGRWRAWWRSGSGRCGSGAMGSCGGASRSGSGASGAWGRVRRGCAVGSGGGAGGSVVRGGGEQQCCRLRDQALSWGESGHS